MMSDVDRYCESNLIDENITQLVIIRNKSQDLVDNLHMEIRRLTENIDRLVKRQKELRK